MSKQKVVSLIEQNDHIAKTLETVHTHTHTHFMFTK